MATKTKKPRAKRVVAIADLHCGHRAGLTPPQWQLNPDNEHDAKWQRIQQEQWEWYRKKITSLRPIDLLLVVGDCVDGEGARANSRDVIRRKRTEQVDMAITCLQLAKAEKISMVYGTRYHVADWEEDICSAFGDKAKIGAHDWPEVVCADGPNVIFDIKHFIGKSQVPYGRATAISRARMWNALWAERKLQPSAHVILRAHVHYFEPKAFITGDNCLGWAMILPALQGMGSEYGAEQCEGLVDFGLVEFLIHPDGRIGWEPHRAVLESHKAKTTKY